MNDLFDYQQDLNALHFTPAQKAHIAEQAVKAARQETNRTRRPLRKMVLVSAAAVLVLAVGTAGATGVLKTAVDAFSGIFGSGTAQTEIIDQIGRPIGASDTSGGVTITADAIIGDQYNAAIVYTVTQDDGTVFDYSGNEHGYLPLLFQSHDTDLGFLSGSHGSSYFVDQTPGDNAVQFVECISADEALKRGTAKATFGDFCYWDEAKGESVPLAEGKWALRFDLDYEDASVTLGGGEAFTQDGLTFTVNSISVSPVAVRVDYTADSEVRWSNAANGRQTEADGLEAARYLENVKVLLTKTDGTVLELPTGGSLSPKDGVTACIKSAVLDEIIPLEELSGVSVGGVAYSIR